METKIKTASFFKGAMLFVIMFVLINVCAGIKYGASGSFSGGIRNTTFYVALASNCVGTLLLLTALFTYVVYSRKKLIEETQRLAVTCSVVVITYVACISVSALGLYYMPVALAAFVLVPLLDRRDVFIANIMTNMLVSVTLILESIMGDKVETISVVVMLVLGVFAGSIVAYAMSNVNKRFKFVLSGLGVGAVGIAMLFVSSLVIDSFHFGSTVGFLCVTAFGQVFVGLVLQPVFEAIFNIVTNTRLTELMSHEAPLIKKLLEEAPGTFNHSLTLANFAEVCAIKIGENPYLAKACAYYHDVGKIKNPLFFSENQSGYNPHDELLPEVSAQILRAHTTDGYEMCIKNHIPMEIAEITLQHHGTLPMAVFYAKAQKLTDGEVDASEYSYHGVTPVSKIAAIIMICDASEAALRAKGAPTHEVAEEIVSSIISDRIKRGQFDNCDITMRDLNVIKQTIVGLYGGVFHARVQYPSGKTR